MQVKMCITRNTPHRTDVTMPWGSVTTVNTSANSFRDKYRTKCPQYISFSA